jgi:hypothetical protein
MFLQTSGASAKAGPEVVHCRGERLSPSGSHARTQSEFEAQTAVVAHRFGVSSYRARLVVALLRGECS